MGRVEEFTEMMLRGLPEGVSVMGVYYGRSKEMPNGEMIYSGDLLLDGTAKWEQMGGDPHVWLVGTPVPRFMVGTNPS